MSFPTISKRIFAIVRSRGVTGTVWYFSVRVFGRIFRRKAKCAVLCEQLLSNKYGLEVGGPSEFFRMSGRLPLYKHTARIDNCNFSAETVWEGEIDESERFIPERGSGSGRQYILEATELSGIAGETYDFVCSSNALEHVANPIKALMEWKRVLRTGGFLVLVLPLRESAFDHRRPLTSLEHLIEDYERDVGEDDLTHLQEILDLHDLVFDPWAGDFERFKERSLENATNRCLHHHVFDQSLVVRMTEYAGFQVLAAESMQPYGIILVGSK